MFFTNVIGTLKKICTGVLTSVTEKFVLRAGKFGTVATKSVNVDLCIFFLLRGFYKHILSDVDLINCYDDEDSGKGSDILIHPFLLVVFSYVSFAFVITLTVVV